MATKVLIVGGTSYVAQFLCARFLDGSLSEKEGNVEVACTLRDPRDLPEGFALATETPVAPSLRRVVRVFPGVSVLALDTVKAAIDAHDPSVAVNCVALSSPAACERDPTTAQALNHPSELVAFLRERSATGKRVHYLHFSTDFVYDGAMRPPLGYREADAVARADHCVYSATKLAFDHHLQAQETPSHLRVTVLRIANVVGGPAPLFRDQPPKFAQWLHRQLLVPSSEDTAATTTPVRLWSDEVRSFLYVEDLVRVVWELIVRPLAEDEWPQAARVLNVGGVDAMTRVEFAERFTRVYMRLYPAIGSRCRPIQAVERASVDLGYRSPLDARLDCSTLQDLLPNIALTPSDEIMHELCTQFHDHTGGP